MTRVKMVKTMAPAEIPNGTLGTVTDGDLRSGMALITWDNDYVLLMYRDEVEEVNEA